MNAGEPSKSKPNLAAWKAFFAERWTEAITACRFSHGASSPIVVALINSCLSGRYRCVVRKIADIDNATQVLEFDNLITDIGLERWGSNSIGDKCLSAVEAHRPLSTIPPWWHSLRQAPPPQT